MKELEELDRLVAKSIESDVCSRRGCGRYSLGQKIVMHMDDMEEILEWLLFCKRNNVTWQPDYAYVKYGEGLAYVYVPVCQLHFDIFASIDDIENVNVEISFDKILRNGSDY